MFLSLAQAVEPACSRDSQELKTKNYGDSGRTKLMESSVRELKEKKKKLIIEIWSSLKFKQRMRKSGIWRVVVGVLTLP